MGLLSTLKSLLGMEDEGGSAGSGVDVTVEREPSAESERAVKEPDEEVESGSGDEPEPEDEPEPATGDSEDEEPVATDTDAAASTESLVDEDHTEDPTRAAETAEAASPGDEGEPEAVGGEPVTVLKGIGPAYADRLADAGVETVADLATADVEDLAERVDLSPKRVGRWVETAQDHD